MKILALFLSLSCLSAGVILLPSSEEFSATGTIVAEGSFAADTGKDFAHVALIEMVVAFRLWFFRAPPSMNMA